MRLVQTGVAVVLSVALIASMAAPAVAETDETLTIDVEQGDEVTVTVAQNGTAVENATVTVEAVNNTTYAGVGTEVTDENGTVSLPTPDENVTVELAAAAGNATATKTVTLLSDADGTEDDEESEDDEEEGAALTFGERVSTFVHGMLNAGEGDGSLGRLVSEFVTANNPGADERSDRANANHGNASSDADTKRPSQAGGQSNTSEDAGAAKNGHEKSDEKRPEHAKNKSSKEKGPKEKGPKDKGDDGDDYEAQPDDADDEDGEDGESETRSGDGEQKGKQNGKQNGKQTGKR